MEVSVEAENRQPPQVKPHEWLALAAVSTLLTVASWRGLLPYELTETLGFVTGAGCVYLVVREHVGNFPLGILNNLVFLVLFTRSRLYGDAGLQIVFMVLGVHGWHQWLHGGKGRSPLRVTRATARTLAATGAGVLLGTAGLTAALYRVNGSAPLLDAFTTVLSLAAQYLLNRKHLESWYLWITADVVYIYLYLTRGLQLTAVLYAIFLGLCIAGLMSWRRALALGVGR